MTEKITDSVDSPEIVRYILNGLVATALHYVVLGVNLQFFEMRSAGLANMVAAVFGISCSFLGSRYFVFREHEGGLLQQARSFLLLYAFIALLHGIVLLVWTDIYGLDYRLGFLMATLMQVSMTYLGNKHLVFKK